MNVYFVLNNITFIWDDEKARINPINHDGITFQQAAEAFFDPFLVVVDASRNEEARDAVITSSRLCQRARCSVEFTVCGSH
jgi:uncharacterized protein